MKLGWLSDCHLNFLDSQERQAFYSKLADHECDAYLITGDIAESQTVGMYLTHLADALKRPIFFSLGNHDYYHDSIEAVQREIRLISAQERYLFWLREEKVIELSAHCALLGVDGWADARYAEITSPKTNVNDNNFIEELVQAKQANALEQAMRYHADIDAKILEQAIQKALKKNYTHILIATHIPPFPINDKDPNGKTASRWLPFYSCKALGDVCLAAAEQNKHVQFDVYSGHVHSGCEQQIITNLSLHTAGSNYGHPRIIKDIEITGEDLWL